LSDNLWGNRRLLEGGKRKKEREKKGPGGKKRKAVEKKGDI